MIDIVELAHVPAQPWRNRGGVTHELWTWPEAGAWQLRVSVARVERDASFSTFEGVERWFAVVQGAGVLLRFDEERRLQAPADEAFSFDGGRPPACELLEGPTLDLNLMARKDAGQARMLKADPSAEWLSAAPLRALFTTAALWLQVDDADAARLPAMSLACSDDAAQQRWRLRGLGDESAPAWWLEFRPHAR